MTRSTDISPLSRLLMRIDAAADGERAPEGIATGFRSLDDLLGGGVRAGDLILLAGDVGAGKSSLALAIALRVRAAMHGVVFLCGEMSPERVLERALAIEGRASIDDMRRGKVDDATRASLGAAALRMREALPVMDRIPSPYEGALEAILVEAAGTKLLVVDSLQSMATGALPRDEELAAAVAELKRVAMNANVAVLATIHLARGLGTEADRRPTLDDLGAHGAARQLADVVLGLYREEMYDAGRSSEGATELILLKNRNGPTSYLDLYFYRSWLRFEDMVDPSR
jgi:replicative DNA helicase